MVKCEKCGFESDKGSLFNQGIDKRIRCRKCSGVGLTREEDEP